MERTPREFTRRSDRIELLVERLETAADPALRAVAQELLEAVLELHGIALERMLDAVAAVPGSEAALQQIASDELVSGVLSLHGLHPVAIEARVLSALEKAKPYLQSHGGNVELAALEGDTVRVRMQGTCGSCASSADTLRQHVEEAIVNAAPEIVHVIAEPMGGIRGSAPQFVILQAT